MNIDSDQMIGGRARHGRAEGSSVFERWDADPTTTEAPSISAAPRDLLRNVYCVLGLPIDAIEMGGALQQIEDAAAKRADFLISTPNLDFLVQARSDPEFKASLLDSNLCLADGMPVVWIARLIGLPIRRRVSGCDMLDALRTSGNRVRALRSFLLGGKDGIATSAARLLNAEAGNVTCVGAINPGFGTVEDISRQDIIDTVNRSGADFLIVSLGSKKGQLWLHRNHNELTIPLRAHLGAALNIMAGTIKRAPAWMRSCGLEWLWRIKTEPYLWRRYTHDGAVLFWLLFTRILPLAVLNRWHGFKSDPNSSELQISESRNHHLVTMKLYGHAGERNIEKSIVRFGDVLTAPDTDLAIDLADVRFVDGRFLGLLLMVRKHLRGQGRALAIIGASPAIRRLFRLNELEFLLGGKAKSRINAAANYMPDAASLR